MLSAILHVCLLVVFVSKGWLKKWHYFTLYCRWHLRRHWFQSLTMHLWSLLLNRFTNNIYLLIHGRSFTLFPIALSCLPHCLHMCMHMHTCCFSITLIINAWFVDHKCSLLLPIHPCQHQGFARIFSFHSYNYGNINLCKPMNFFYELWSQMGNAQSPRK